MALVKKLSGEIVLKIEGGYIKTFYMRPIYQISDDCLKEISGRWLYTFDGRWIKKISGQWIYRLEYLGA